MSLVDLKTFYNSFRDLFIEILYGDFYMEKLKTLIVYYSFSGNNEILAKKLQSRLGCEIYKVTETKMRNSFDVFLDVLFKRSPKINKPYISLSKFDHIILIAPIWAGRIANPLRVFLQMEMFNIRSYSFVTLCGGGNNMKVEDELLKIMHKRANAVLELAVNDLLPPEKKNKMKYTSAYRVITPELKIFDEYIDGFLKRALVSQSVKI